MILSFFFLNFLERFVKPTFKVSLLMTNGSFFISEFQNYLSYPKYNSPSLLLQYLKPCSFKFWMGHNLA